MCGNNKVSSSPLQSQPDEKTPQKRTPRKSIKNMARTSDVMELPHGHWTQLETISLIVLINLLKGTNLPLNDNVIASFYDSFHQYVQQEKDRTVEIPIRTKSVKQISGKVKDLMGRFL